jgi:hypothetical protein
MITEEIDALVGHIRTTAKINTSFGLRDLTPQDYPHAQLVPGGPIEMSNNRATMSSVSLTVNIRIICSRENEREALVAYERVLQALNTYHQSKGHRVSGEGTQEYGPDTFIIVIPYVIEAII